MVEIREGNTTAANVGSGINKLTTAIASIVRANPLGIAIVLLIRRFWNKAKSAAMGAILRAPGLELGPGCRVLGAKHISFGKAVYAGRNLWLEAVTSYGVERFDPRISIGDHVRFSDSVHISATSTIAIGPYTLFGSNIYVSDHSHGVYTGEGQSRPDQPPAHRRLGGGGPVVIGQNVWIGDNSVILGPANIGAGAIIGANSVVRGEVPSNTVAAGAPAKPIRVFNFKTGLWDRA
jgi:acetyltransferase-like isoleucine patch superfamily enzyme